MPLPKTKKRGKTKAATKATKPVAGKNGKQPKNKKDDRPAKPAPPQSPPQSKAQFSAFERGIGLLHKRNFRDAKEMFAKALQGPNREMASNAALHIRMCERRLSAPAPEPKSAEEHYNYAIALINLRNLDPARKHLATALEMEPRADHVHYALSVCLALSGDTSGAYDSLRRAIELQPRNRMVAREDSDFDGISNQPQFTRLLYPERDH
jgi:tetratricopeptide (TPR) repeat protein